jgi:hypothetical protein
MILHVVEPELTIHASKRWHAVGRAVKDEIAKFRCAGVIFLLGYPCTGRMRGVRRIDISRE